MTRIKRPFRVCDLFFDNGYGHIWLAWLQFWNSLNALNQLETYEAKAEWAQRKRLHKVRRHYDDTTNHFQWRLRGYREESRWVVSLAEWVHVFRRQMIM